MRQPHLQELLHQASDRIEAPLIGSVQLLAVAARDQGQRLKRGVKCSAEQISRFPILHGSKRPGNAPSSDVQPLQRTYSKACSLAVSASDGAPHSGSSGRGKVLNFEGAGSTGCGNVLNFRGAGSAETGTAFEGATAPQALSPQQGLVLGAAAFPAGPAAMVPASCSAG